MQPRVRYGVFTPASFREFLPGYGGTSYGSPGKTVAYGRFSDSTAKAATHAPQPEVVHNAFGNDAISMTKRYFTSFLTRRS